MANSPETNQSFYDRISHAYDLIADAGEHKARESGEEALDVQPGESVLEIGFGTGSSLINLCEKVGPTGRVSGLDVSPGMQAVAEKKLAEKQLLDRVSLKVGDARSMDFDDNSFDAAFTSFTLELFEIADIPTVLAEVKRVLKPEGRLGVVSMATVQDGDKPTALEKTYIWMHQHFPHIVDCQPIDVIGLLEASQFEIKVTYDVAIWSMPVRIAVATPSAV